MTTAAMALADAAPKPPPLQEPTPLSSLVFSKESRNLSCLVVTSLVSILFALSFSFSSLSLSSSVAFTKNNINTRLASLLSLHNSLPPPPSLAYLVTGSTGDHNRILRLLSAVYHPKNIYLLHLDLEANQSEREALAYAVQKINVYMEIGNVHVVGHAGNGDTKGSSSLAVVLHGAAALLKLSKHWNWFLNLDVSDYPLVTQDDLLHILAFLPREINFIQHTDHFDPREFRRLKRVMIDPGLYLSTQPDQVFYGTQQRELPDAFRIFTGSGSVILTRNFIEYCILGTDNLPRSILMYYTNTLSSHTKYFHTVVCNSLEFKNTVFNSNLHFASSADLFKNMSRSGAAFRSGFVENDPILDRIDLVLLGKLPSKIIPGGWCLEKKTKMSSSSSSISNECSVLGDANILRPGPGAKRLENFILKFISDSGGSLRARQCISDRK
ncbi:Core-2/I-branching beta-1,6-N-acetylglucosaminyltransferase familyprotein [Zostera marina]|uniref:Core-2/I-branching beta-1,6-N-acetylglucosaminyltransferase familyprotein n=1 Tax=Zostera marina TaxID=29655 RepID=A0A0K9Q378_ZOSMR|nr:Core-2/I-branching beta-1,6-N-acetylglucosaminyltransferase familyprotein [Zostera marina]